MWVIRNAIGYCLLRARSRCEIRVEVIDRGVEAAGVQIAPQRGHHVDRDRTVARCHLAQAVARLLHDPGERPVAALGFLPERLQEAWPGKHFLFQQAWHLVARSADIALGFLEREHRLAGDELRQSAGISGVGGIGVGEARTQLAERRACRDQGARTSGVAAVNQVLADATRGARIAQQQATQSPAPLVLARTCQPHHPQGHEVAVAAAPEELAQRLVIVSRSAIRRSPAGSAVHRPPVMRPHC